MILTEARAALARAHYGEAERLALASAAAAGRAGDTETEARALSVAVLSCLEAGDGRGAAKHALRGVRNVDVGRTPRPLHGVAFADAHAAHVLLGAAGTARHHLERARRACGDDDPARWRLEADHGYAQLALLGDPASAAVTLAAAFEPNGSKAEVRAHLALAYALNRQRGEAQRHADALGDGGPDAWVLLSLARVWQTLGARHEAKEAADRAARAARLCGRSDWRAQAAAVVRACERGI